MQQIDISEAKTQFPALLEAARHGAEIIITENAQPVVRLAYIGAVAANGASIGTVGEAATSPKRTLGAALGQVWLAPDFNDSYEDFSDELIA